MTIWRLGYFFIHFKWPSSQDQQKSIRRRLITSKVTLTVTLSWYFWLRKVTLPNHIISIKWLWWILTRWPLFCKSLVRVVFLHMEFGGFIYIMLKIRQMCSVHCTILYMVWLCRITPAACQITSISYHECTRSHQLRTMNARGHINSEPWMNVVTPSLYHECTQFVDSVKPLSFSLSRRSFQPIAYIDGTKFVWLRSFMVNAIW